MTSSVESRGDLKRSLNAQCNDLLNLLGEGRLNRALRGARCLTGDHSEFAPGWEIMAYAQRITGDIAGATSSAQRAVQLDPAEPTHALELACCYFQENELEKFLETLRTADAIKDKSNEVLYRLAVLYGYIGEYEKSLRLLVTAVRNVPDNAMFRYQLGQILRYKGNFKDAERAFEEAVALDSHCYEAHLERAGIRQQDSASSHIGELEGLLSTGVGSKRGAVTLLYALGKEYEDLGEYRKAFINFARGAALQREMLTFRVDDHIKLFDLVMDTYEKKRSTEVVEGHESDRPIFIIGMPRTGTTLVERILGSHSNVIAGGETYELAWQLQRLGPRAAQSNMMFTHLSAGLIETSVEVDPMQLGAAYLRNMDVRVGCERRFTDKLPVNFFYCGLIRRALPNAAIIHVTRNPMDTCLSIFKQLFAEGAYPFSYRLEEIAHYFVAYRRLMEHWETYMPGGILNVSYEDLVLHPEKQTRRLLSYCNLGWEDSCLSFHDNPAPTATASAVQVRRPIYRTAIGYWQRYAEFLEPLREFLVKEDISI